MIKLDHDQIRLNKVLFIVRVKFLVLILTGFLIIKRFKREEKLPRSKLKKGLENFTLAL